MKLCILTKVKLEVSDMTWPGVLKKLEPEVLSFLFRDGVLITSMKLGSKKNGLRLCCQGYAANNIR